MRMLHMICVRTLEDGISNDTIRDMTCMKKIEEFLRKKTLQWFGHVKKMDDEKAPVKAKKIAVGSKKRHTKEKMETAHIKRPAG